MLSLHFSNGRELEDISSMFSWVKLIYWGLLFIFINNILKLLKLLIINKKK
jgi:hypothetical protein